ncbi:TadE/TadG family type IV pilus assembly protein [Leucobacter musarum]|uniref:TadE/TadG family type IV pilus assembly protein n=1 Tax=Leucobacter musarum TaxID=1930747 RepID=UPI0006A7BD69|nr:hypothetical protein [Leucobacter musarum]
MRPALRNDDRGTVTAEFAIVIPAVLVVLGLVIGGVSIAAHRIALVSIVADATRLEARGDTDAAAGVLAQLSDRARIERDTSGQILCLTARDRPGRGPLSVVQIAARSCAALTGMGATA